MGFFFADASTPYLNAWCYTSTHQYVFIAWYLVKHKESFTLYKIILLSFTSTLCYFLPSGVILTDEEF